MSDPTFRWAVDHCSSCPFQRRLTTSTFCGRDEKARDVPTYREDGGDIPEWCALRQRPVLVQLDSWSLR